MKRFSVRIQNSVGEEEVREIAANSLEEAQQMATLQGFAGAEINEISGDNSSSWWGSVSLSELFHFTRLFGTLIKAGLPILEALETIRERTTNQHFQNVLNQIYGDIQSGTNMGTAFGAHPDVFDFTYQSMIKVGEESGELGRVLQRLVLLLDRKIKLRRAIRRALTYPILVLCISSLVTYAILTFIVPRFKEIYKRFGGDLPGITKFTISTSDFLLEHSVGLFIGLALVILLIHFAGKTRTGKRIFDHIILSLPLLGPMFHTFEIAQFSQNFSILIHSGVTVTTSLDILNSAISREPIREAAIAANEAIRSGKPMGESFGSQEPWFPDLFNRMVAVGERSGNLTEMLDHIAEFYEEEFHNRVETLASLIEPILIVFLGLVIGGIVISLYLPIFGMAKLIARR